MTNYRNFALLYDELMKDAPYDEWVEFTNQIIKNKQVKTVVDLGCGTGEITLRLAKNNRQLFGVDLSADMLTIAEQKTIKQGKDVTWIKQDIRELQGFSNTDLCISYCDVINYIVTEEDLERVFSNVYNSLADGGLFIFDVHSMAHVEKNLTDEVFSYNSESIAYIWHCDKGEEVGEMYHDISFFQQSETDSDMFLRTEEVHHQRTFSVKTYIALLKAAKFINIEVYSDFSLDKDFSEENSERIFIVAKK